MPGAAARNRPQSRAALGLAHLQKTVQQLAEAHQQLGRDANLFRSMAEQIDSAAARLTDMSLGDGRDEHRKTVFRGPAAGPHAADAARRPGR